MAEAAVEDRPHQKFYCHLCNVQFENASANFTCPHCFGGFVEVLEAAPENPPDVDVDMISDDDDEPYNMLNYRMDFTDLFLAPGPPEMRRTGRQRYPQDPSRRRRTLTRLASSNMRHQTPFEHLIQEVILNLGVGVDWAGGGNMQLILGNPADYAWGREGLDAIVTQLLNQMDGTGPPPLSKEVIDALPVVEVTDQQVDAKLQCSVCWEDFVIKECVRQLPCQHIYHEPCIRPWLELHGTCPICRQNLSTGDNPNDGNQASGNAGSGRTTYDALEQLLWSSGNRSNSPSSSTATRGSDSPTSSNSSSIFALFFFCAVFSCYLYYLWTPSELNCISNPNKTYTHIIVGAGTAGCVLAARLSENPQNRILLIEAGGHFNLLSKIPLLAVFLQKSSHDWGYETVPQKWSSLGFYNKKQALPRGKGLGGSNQINLLIYGGINDEPEWELRDTLIDFVRSKKCSKVTVYLEHLFLPKPNMCAQRCKKFFKFRVQRSTSNLGDVLKLSLKELNHLATTYYRGEAAVYKGERWSTYRSHLVPASHRKNLHILCNTEVNKILFKDKVAIGVQLFNNYKIYGTSEIIISSGSINTPKLLLLSGVGDKQWLQEVNVTQIHDLPGVGQNLHDHLAVPIYIEIKKTLSLTLSKIINFSNVIQYITSKTGIFGTSPVGGFIKTPNNFVIMFTGSTPETPFRKVANYLSKTFRNIFPFANNISHEGFVMLSGCKNTLSRGFIKLKADGSVVIDPQYLQEDEDVECVKEAMHLAYKILDTSYFKNVGVQVHYPQFPNCLNLTKDAYFNCLIRIAAMTTYHQAGTCKMGDDALSVVDHNFRVKGIGNLRIVDASVLPTPSNNFPNTVITLMAEYASLILNR